MSDRKIQEWVEVALRHEDIINYTFSVDGTIGKDEGYLGDIFFLVVSGVTELGKPKILKLVLKVSKESVSLRQQAPIKEAFEKEIFIYGEVLNSFKKFQQEMGNNNILDFLPYCYATRISNQGEMLALENLKTVGYTVWDRKLPMTYEHIELVMQAYGKWHAFSFALREKRSDIFKELCKDNVNMFSHFTLQTNLETRFLEDYTKSTDVCISSKEKEIFHNLLHFSEIDANYNFTGLFSEEEKYHVISHGDCWNNNFMFKCDFDPTKPSRVYILDWQCSGLSSPVMDLSHFLYGCSDTGKYKDVSVFLKIYYQSLTACLEKLGCEAEKLFPYEKLLEHWRRFSRYGILLHAFVLKFSLCETEDAPDLAEDIEEGIALKDKFNVEISNSEEFYKRARNNLLHYVQNSSIK